MRAFPRYALLVANVYAVSSAASLHFRSELPASAFDARPWLLPAFFVACLVGLLTGVALVFFYAARVLRSDLGIASRAVWLAALFLAAPVGTMAAWFVFAHRE